MKWFFYFLNILIFFSLSLIFKNYFPEGYQPLFNLIGMIFFIIYFDFNEAILYSFLSGLFLDFFSSFFGFHLFLFLFLSTIIYFLKTEIIQGEGFLSFIFFVWFGLTIYYFALIFLFKPDFSLNFFIFYFLKIFLESFLVNTLFTILMYWPLLEFKNFIDKSYNLK